MTPSISLPTLLQKSVLGQAKNALYRTEFWNAVQSSWKRESDGISSSLHFFRIDCNVFVKSEVYLQWQMEKRQALV